MCLRSQIMLGFVPAPPPVASHTGTHNDALSVYLGAGRPTGATSSSRWSVACGGAPGDAGGSGSAWIVGPALLGLLGAGAWRSEARRPRRGQRCTRCRAHRGQAAPSLPPPTLDAVLPPPTLDAVLPPPTLDAVLPPPTLDPVRPPLTLDAVLDFQTCPKLYEYRHVLRETASGSPEAFTEQLVRLVLRKLLAHEPAAERTLQRAKELLGEVVMEVDLAGAPSKEAVPGCFGAALRCLETYFCLEEPAMVHVPAIGREVSAAVEGGQVFHGRLERVDTEITSEDGAVVSVVDYETSADTAASAGVGRARIALQAWLLRESGEFAYDCLHARLLHLGSSGGTDVTSLSPSDHAQVGRGVRAAQQEIASVLAGPRSFHRKVSSFCVRCPYESACVAEFSAATERSRSHEEDPARLGAPSQRLDRLMQAGAEQRFSDGAGEDPRASTAGVTVVDTPAEAQRVVKMLMSLREQHRFHALDTETKDWEPDLSTYGHGRVICFSIYCGDDVDFGSGPRVWVDNMDEKGNTRGLIEYFRPYLEDAGLKKVFHNYSFDRAMFFNEGVTVAGFAGDTMHMARLQHSDRLHYSLEILGETLLGIGWGKQSLKELMREEHVKRPEDLHLSTSATTRSAWTEYSTFDTVATWKLHAKLCQELSSQEWRMPRGQVHGTLLDFYKLYWRPFAEVLVAIEERGVPVDVAHLEMQKKLAKQHLADEEQLFFEWVQSAYLKRYPDRPDLVSSAAKFNPRSAQQLRHFLFGSIPKEIANVLVGGLGLPDRLCQGTTPKGELAVGGDQLAQLAGPDPAAGESGCGSALPHLGVEGCVGIGRRWRMMTIQKAVTTFLEPLQEWVDSAGRVHTSLNIHTSTGRLTSSRPNLQQLPSLDKDVYGVRRAIACVESNRLIVADYGQLDLRVLAHTTGCKAMIAQLWSGIDFHSGTALHMYAHVREAVDRGEVVLEKPRDGECCIPLVKDKFPTERRFAKAVNFGIAYGLSAKGLADQLKCEQIEAQDMIDKWYQAYPEVKAWQEEVVRDAVAHPRNRVVTLRGRWRSLEDLRHLRVADPKRGGILRTIKTNSKAAYTDLSLGRAAQRQAINAPVQGGSADVVIEAMLKAHSSEVLRELGYSMILQVHDELVFEGPAAAAEKALEAVREIMEHPFLDGSELAVPLPVAAVICRSWGEAK